MNQYSINPLRIVLLLIGVFSALTNFVLLVFLLSGSTAVLWYMAGVGLVSVACLIGAEIADHRKAL